MGWLYMRSLGSHAGPRQYLDAQFTFDQPGARCRVLRSALLRLRTYYAAIERVFENGDRSVSAIVCLVRYNPNDREGYVFGYKDMDEVMGPVESECPEAILDLLTPTNGEYALAWRARCRANAACQRERSVKPRPRPGQTVVFDQPLVGKDGRRYERLVAVANPRSPRTLLFRDPEGGGPYSVTNLKRREYRLVDG